MSYSIGFITGTLSIALPMLTNNLLLKLVIILVVCFFGSFINGYFEKKEK